MELPIALVRRLLEFILFFIINKISKLTNRMYHFPNILKDITRYCITAWNIAQWLIALMIIHRQYRAENSIRIFTGFLSDFHPILFFLEVSLLPEGLGWCENGWGKAAGDCSGLSIGDVFRAFPNGVRVGEWVQISK